MVGVALCGGAREYRSGAAALRGAGWADLFCLVSPAFGLLLYLRQNTCPSLLGCAVPLPLKTIQRDSTH